MKRIPLKLRTKATRLHDEYVRLGVPATQNVRNPLPMKHLVYSALNEAVPNGVPITVKAHKMKVKAFGTVVEVEPEIQVTPEMAHGEGYLEKKGLTVVQVYKKLRRQGYIANQTTVRQMLSNLRTEGRIKSINSTIQRPIGRGRPHAKYFIPLEV